MQVRLSVARDLVTRRFANLGVEPLRGTYRRVRPASITVELRGSGAELDAIDAAQLIPVVDLEGVPATGAHPLPIQLRGVPDGIEVVSVAPAEVIVVR